MINKNWTFVLSTLSLTTAFLAADQGSKGMNQNQMNQPMPMGVTSQPTGVITPPVAPVVNNGADFFIEADFIYWYVQEDGLAYAKTSQVGDGELITIRKGTVAQANRRWEPGFKLGVGLEFEHDGWDLFANWTWLNPISNSTSSVATDRLGPRGFLVTDILQNMDINLTDPSVQNNSQVTSAKSIWSLHFNVLDLEMGRDFFLSRFLTLRPHFGLKTSWINQDFNRYYGIDGSITISGKNSDGDVVTRVINCSELMNDQSLDTWGIGIRAGLQPVWHFSKNWGLYGSFAMSAMYTYYGADSSVYVMNDAGQQAQITSYTKSNHAVTPVLELGLGLEWMTWFCNDGYMLHVKAGWEEQVWFNANQFIASPQNGNLTFQGFTFNVGFHF